MPVPPPPPGSSTKDVESEPTLVEVDGGVWVVRDSEYPVYFVDDDYGHFHVVDKVVVANCLWDIKKLGCSTLFVAPGRSATGQPLKRKALTLYAELKAQTEPDRKPGPQKQLADLLDDARGLAELAHVVLNSNEFVYIN